MAEHFQSKMRRRGVVVHVEPAKSRSSKSDEEPAEKRRRVEEKKESKTSKQMEEDDIWDELTQEDMANIDILESQAISHLPAEPPSKEVGLMLILCTDLLMMVSWKHCCIVYFFVKNPFLHYLSF